MLQNLSLHSNAYIIVVFMPNLLTWSVTMVEQMADIEFAAFLEEKGLPGSLVDCIIGQGVNRTLFLGLRNLILLSYVPL